MCQPFRPSVNHAIKAPTASGSDISIALDDDRRNVLLP
jgi:hypothetical protein